MECVFYTLLSEDGNSADSKPDHASILPILGIITIDCPRNTTGHYDPSYCMTHFTLHAVVGITIGGK